MYYPIYLSLAENVFHVLDESFPFPSCGQVLEVSLVPLEELLQLVSLVGFSEVLYLLRGVLPAIIGLYQFILLLDDLFQL